MAMLNNQMVYVYVEHYILVVVGTCVFFRCPRPSARCFCSTPQSWASGAPRGWTSSWISALGERDNGVPQRGKTMGTWGELIRGIPSGYVKIAIENGHRNSGFSHWKWWFSIVMWLFTRGYGPMGVKQILEVLSGIWSDLTEQILGFE